MSEKQRANSVRPSKDAVKRARQAVILNRLTEDREYFRILSSWFNQVTFFYGGYYVKYETYYGVVCRREQPTEKYRYLSTEDYTLLKKLAEDIIESVKRGMREANEARKEKAARRPKEKSVRTKKSKEPDPRQIKLI